jgi:prepilin-type N-terminal cleavage/methylation domain-containing protein
MILSRIRNAGFTMIELLVVIAVIGVLAVAVLSSINPIEQINKGRDTRTRSDAAQLIGAIDRYYSSLELYPWNTVDSTEPLLAIPDATALSCPAGGAAPYTLFCDISAAGTTWLTKLTETAEVKTAFVSRLQNPPTANAGIYLYKDTGTDATIYVCFAPSSKSFQVEAIKNCTDRNGEIPAGACSSPPAGGYTYNTEYTNELICLP